MQIILAAILRCSSYLAGKCLLPLLLEDGSPTECSDAREEYNGKNGRVDRTLESQVMANYERRRERNALFERPDSRLLAGIMEVPID